jgi:HK97 family phage major capsid protein
MTKHNALARESLALERKDDNNRDIAEITREIKTFGDDVKGLKDSMNRDLTAVRKLAEDASKAAANTPELKSQIEALTTSVGEKHAAIQKIVDGLKEQADRVETAFKRSPRGGDEKEDKSVEHAVEFFSAKMAAEGTLKEGNRPTAETIDRDGYTLWEKSYGKYLRANDSRAIDQKALSVGSNTDGGYLVPTAQSARIIQKIYESSPIRRLATVETIGTSELEIAIDDGDLNCGWVGEAQARPETGTPLIGTQKIPVHEIYAKPRATQKLLEDASINVEGWLNGKVGSKMARVEATALVIGDGIGKPRGVLSYPAGTGRNFLPQFNSGNATLITADAIVSLPYQLKSAYLANATWLMKRTTVMAVMLLKDSQNQYLWRPGLAAGQPSTLGSYSIEMADDMPIVAAGNLPIAFGDFRQGYTVVDRLGITTLRDPFSAKPFVEFYSRKRVGGDVVDFDALVLMKISA